MTLLFEFFLHHKTSIFDSCIKSFRGICTICHVSIKWSYASTHNSGKIFVNDHNLFSCSYFTSLSDCSSVFLQYKNCKIISWKLLHERKNSLSESKDSIPFCTSGTPEQDFQIHKIEATSKYVLLKALLLSIGLAWQKSFPASVYF